tara:strand:+ start:230 stop:976 length:747 start_codon:yes stop_codon:yes gene_type:complete
MFDISLLRIQSHEARPDENVRLPHHTFAPEIRFRDHETALSGMLAGTRVATVVGWQKIETLQVGDAVLTFDNGLQPLRAITRLDLWSGAGDCPKEQHPLHVPAAAIGNREDLILLPRQGVLIESATAERAFGDPLVLLRAEVLDGLCATSRRRATPGRQVYLLEFDDDQLVFASTGALCICPAGGDLLNRRFARPTGTGGQYTVLSMESDPALIAEILWELDVTWAGIVARKRQQADRRPAQGSRLVI